MLLTTLTLVVLDGAIANLALPSIAASLRASPDATVWVVTAYQLAVLVALLPCGALGEKLGARRVYLAGVAVFTLASAGCALSGSLTMLVVARFAQGLGGGAIMALAVMNLRHVVPHRLVGTIIGINAMVIAIASAAGPGIAGAILTVASWPWLFAVNIPLGLIVLVFGFVLPFTPGQARRIPGAAMVINGAMFVLFFVGGDRLVQQPLLGGAMMLGAVLCLAALLRVQRGSATPLLPTDLLALPAFRIALIASVSCFTGQMLSLIALPFYLQHGLGMTPIEAGLYMMPLPAATAVIAPISGRLADRFKTAWLCGAGGGLMAVGLAAIAVLPSGPGGTMVIAGTMVAGLGFGLFQTPNNRILLLSAPRARSGAAGAMQGTARLSGQTLGAIVMAILFAVLAPTLAPELALLVAAVFAGLAALISLGRARFEPAA
ncbi:MAG: MFS transporter [Pseudorhodobacter sp.]|nr:MFS transporter [Pseudorhodobacter sp.]